jgi:hypothetical protein
MMKKPYKYKIDDDALKYRAIGWIIGAVIWGVIVFVFVL